MSEIPIYRRADLKAIAGKEIEQGQAVGIGSDGLARPMAPAPTVSKAKPPPALDIYGIDPGPEESALVGIGANGIPYLVAIWPNSKILEFLRVNRERADFPSSALLAIESMASYGMPVGDPVFVSCYWIGRFAEAWGGSVRLIKAPNVRDHLCGTPRGKKAHVRQALLNRYAETGGGERRQIGTKKEPGPLYGFKSHAWSALAVAVTARESDLGVTLNEGKK